MKQVEIVIIGGIILFFIFNPITSNISSSQELRVLKNNKSEQENIILKIAVTGDLLTLTNVQESAEKMMDNSIEDPFERVASGFESLFSEEIIELISSADIAFGNLEEPIAEGLTERWYYNQDGRPICEKINVEPGDLYDGKAYKYNPRMIINAHPAFALALKKIGYDVVSTANNHYANRASNGIDATIDALRNVNLDFIGTIKYDEVIDENNDGYPDNTPYIIKNTNDIKTAFLAFTVGQNRIVGGIQIHPVFLGKYPPADKFCSRQTYAILSNNAPVEFNINNFCKGIKRAKNNSDIVLVSTHFGIWQKHHPSPLQIKIVKRFLEAGADVIIGHGPHVIQPIKKYITNDNRTTFIIYSLGNFLVDGGTNNTKLFNAKVSFIGLINIVKNSDDKIYVKNITYIPTFSLKTRDDLTKVVTTDKYGLKKADKIVQIIMKENWLKQFLLSQFYLSKVPGSRIMIKDDMLLNNWILLKWNLEKNASI